MALICARCGRELFPFDTVCPFCGREKDASEAVEMTMDGLRAACDRYGVAPEVLGLSIGHETAFPGTGAFYRDARGVYILSRVREDGTREVLSEGTEEARVAEVFVWELKEAWLKKHPGYQVPGMRGAPAGAKPPSFLGARHAAGMSAPRENGQDSLKLRTRVLWAAFLILVLLAVFYYFKADKNAGYYTVGGVTYVYYDDTWYTGEGSDWTPTEQPEGFSWDGEWEFDTITSGGFADSPYYGSVTWPTLWGGEGRP